MVYPLLPIPEMQLPVRCGNWIQRLPPADLWKSFSIPPDQAVKALLPLMRGTLHNIENIGIPQCLTGPIARGDMGTIQKHLDEIRQKTPELLFPYKELGLQTIPIALAKGKINKEQAKEMEMLLTN